MKVREEALEEARAGDDSRVVCHLDTKTPRVVKVATAKAAVAARILLKLVLAMVSVQL